MDNVKKNEILDYLKTHRRLDTCERFHIQPTTLRKIVSDSGVVFEKGRLNMSKLKLDVDYFKDINSPKKAYWLGYICADGSINKQNAKLSLISKDFEFLEKIKKDVNSEHKISEITLVDKRTNKVYSEYSLQITNSIFTKHIVDKGVTNKKSDILIFPDIKEEFYPYFIAGMFDGDGSVIVDKLGKIRCSLISTKEVLCFINDYFYNKFGWIPCKLVKVTENKDNVYKMHVYAHAYDFLKFIYCGDGEIYLSRKYRVFSDYKDVKVHHKSYQRIAMYDSSGCFEKLYRTTAEAMKDNKLGLTKLYSKNYGDIIYTKDKYWLICDGVIDVPMCIDTKTVIVA